MDQDASSTKTALDLDVGQVANISLNGNVGAEYRVLLSDGGEICFLMHPGSTLMIKRGSIVGIDLKINPLPDGPALKIVD